MAVPMIFLKLDVKGQQLLGDAKIRGHTNEIACEDLDWSITTEKPGQGNTANARSVVQPKEVTLNKFIDVASPGLYRTMLNREPFSSALFTMLSMMGAGANSREYWKLMTLQVFDGYVERVDVNASGGSKSMKLTEKVTLSYQKCKLMYYPARQGTGGREAPSTFEMVVPKAQAHRV